uniref:DPPIV_N domain-containing protein n=1 Tax=Trichuris muris TaxID=70415 RepID=A0A5S6QER2_TRIMR
MVDQPMPGNDSSEKATNDFAHFLSTVTTVQQDFSSLAHFYAICVQISHEISAQREGEGSRPFLRLYGMGVPVSNDRTCLLSFDYRLDESHPETGYWQTLMDPALVKPIGKLSLEEELLRERKRSFASMFLTVDFSPKHNAFLYAQCGEVFEFQDNPSQGGNSVNSFPNSIGNPVNLVYCPDKPQYFAMVIGNDVYVYNKQTSFCSIARPTECDWIYGSPPFVIQEEFERFEGIWWCPKNEQQTLLLVEAYNQRTVQKVTLGLGTCGGDLERISYPYAGTDNALWNLKLYALSERDDQFSLVNCPFKYDFNALFPWAEYLVKCGWLPDGSAIWLLLMDRLQRLVRLVYVPLHCFAIDSLSCKTGHQRGITVVYEETSNHWLPAHNSLVLLQPKYKDSIRFTWLSRKSGFSHLYLVDAALSCEADDEPKPCARVKETVDIIEEVQLTAGEWDVSLSARIEVDEARSLIYFLAVADTPLESHIYVTSYSTPGMNPVRLSEPGYSYGIPRERKCIIFNDDHSIMATFRSSVTCPGESIVYSLSFPEHGNESDPLTPCVKDLILLKMPSKEVNDYSTSQDSAENNISIKCLAEHRLLRGVPPRPLVVELQFDTFKLYSYLYRPFDWKEGEVCPTVVYVYGGPGFQLVRNSWTR